MNKSEVNVSGIQTFFKRTTSNTDLQPSLSITSSSPPLPPLSPPDAHIKRNPSCQLNTEIENEVKNFTNKSSHQPTDEEFLELESTIREIRANYCKDGSGFVAGTEDGRASAGPSSGRNGDTTGSSRVSEVSSQKSESKHHHRKSRNDSCYCG